MSASTHQLTPPALAIDSALEVPGQRMGPKDRLRSELASLPYEQQVQRLKPPVPLPPLGTAVQRQPDTDTDTDTDTDSEAIAEGEPTHATLSETELAVARQLVEQHPDGLVVSLMVPVTLSPEDLAALAEVSGRGKVSNVAYKTTYEHYWEEKEDTLRAAGVDNASWGKLDDAQRATAKDLMWADVRMMLTKAERANDRYIRDKAEDFAKAFKAVALASDGSIDPKPRAMEYGSRQQISDLVNGVHHEAARLLEGAGLDDPSLASVDRERVSRVSCLTISAHGDKDWLGAHYLGSAASFGTTEVDELVTAMADSLNDDVVVRLFACSTAKKAQEASGFAYELALQLAGREKKEAVVVAHAKAGRTTKNRAMRFVLADGSVYDWRAGDMLTEDAVDDELERFGFDLTLDDEGLDLLYARMDTEYAKLLESAAAKDLFSESGWVGGASNLDELRASFWAQWRATHPEAPAFYEELLAELESHRQHPAIPMVD